MASFKSPSFESRLSKRLAFWKRSDNAQLHFIHWYPLALRWWNLTYVIALCWTFIAILQYLLIRSQRDGGIIFATDINALSVGLKLSYRYLPTLVTVTFSIFVLWIDNDARRYEPCHLMLRPGRNPCQKFSPSALPIQLHAVGAFQIFPERVSMCFPG